MNGQGGKASVPPAPMRVDARRAGPNLFAHQGPDHRPEGKHSGTGSITGIAGGFFEWDLGTMPGWYPLPEGLF